LLTFKEEEEGGRARVTTSEQRVLNREDHIHVDIGLKVEWWWRLCMWEKESFVYALLHYIYLFNQSTRNHHEERKEKLKRKKENTHEQIKHQSIRC